MRNHSGPATGLRPLRVLACLIGALALPGCFGGDDGQRKPTGALETALSYLRSDSGVAFVIATDVEDGVLTGLESRRSRSDGRKALEAVLRSELGQRGISFGSVIRPRLGNPFVAGITRGGDRVGAMRVRDAAGLRRDVEQRLDQGKAERLDDYEGALVWKEKRADEEATYAGVHESELVVAQSENDLQEAIDAAGGSDSLAFDRSFRARLESLGRGALVRAAGDAQRLLESGDPGQAADARKVRWVKALSTFTLVARVVGRGVSVDFNLTTNGVRLSERDLPLRPGVASPRLHDPDAPASAAVLEPQQLVRFLERTLRATDPARFARYETGIDQLRAILRVNLHRDLIDKIRSLSLAATSATAFTFEGTLAPGAGPSFRRDLDRAQLFVEGFLGDVLPGTGVEAHGSGAQRVWVVKNRGLTLARYAVRGGMLVGSVGSAQLPRPVRGTRLRGVTGSLVLKGDLGRIGRLLGVLLEIPNQAFGVVARLGDLTLGVRTGTKGVVASGRLRVGRAR